MQRAQQDKENVYKHTSNFLKSIKHCQAAQTAIENSCYSSQYYALEGLAKLLA